MLTKTTLIRLSVCPCGFPALKTDIPLGTVYHVDFDVNLPMEWCCGGCRQWQDVTGVFVAARTGGGRDGFLPAQLFEEPPAPNECQNRPPDPRPVCPDQPKLSPG